MRTSSALLLAALVGWCVESHAAAPGGTQIVNQASVTFTDPSGTQGTSLTNEVTMTVQTVHAATIAGDQNLDVISGGSVYFHHQLRNIGNVEDTYCLSASVVDGADIAGTLQLYEDTNHDGAVTTDDRLLLSNVSQEAEVRVAAGDQASLILQVTPGETAATNESIVIDLLARAKQGTSDCLANTVQDVGDNADSLDGTNRDRVTLVDQAVVTLEKSSLYTRREQPLEDFISYRLLISNSGSQSATDLTMSDLLPSQLTLIDGSLTIDNAVAGSTVEFSNDTIVATIPSLPAGDTVSVNFRVLVSDDPTLEDLIANQATLLANTDGIAGVEPAVSSNQTVDSRASEAAVELTDTGQLADAAENDGGDDDGTLNDIQSVQQSTTTGEILFTFRATNLGVSPDVLTPGVASSDLPAGSSVRFLRSGSLVPLFDQNGDDQPDLGEVNPGETQEFIMALTLPDDDSVQVPLSIPVTITSSNDPTETDPSTALFNTVLSEQVDLANALTAEGFNDGGSVNADPATLVTTTENVEPGDTVTFPLHVANEGQNAEAYRLSVFADAGQNNALPSDVSVRFETTDGAAITATPLVSAGTSFSYFARVSVAETAASGAVPLFFVVEGLESGASDIKQDALIVASARQIALSPDSLQQVNACGSVDHTHQLRNSGNTAENIELSLQSTGPMSSDILVPTSVLDGRPSEFRSLANLTAGNSVALLPNGAADWQTTTLTLSNGALTIPLDVGDLTNVVLRVQAPCRVQDGERQQDTLIAESVDGELTERVRDITLVATSQLRMIKLGARDTACSGNADSDLRESGLTALPGECIIWNLTVTNEGAAQICNVTVSDGAPAFSTLFSGPVIANEPAPGTGVCVTNSVTFNCSVGNALANPVNAQTENFCLRAGESADVTFSVQID